MRKHVSAFTGIMLLLIITNIPSLFAQDPRMRTVGELASTNLYLTYISIGAVADSHSRQIYGDEFAASLMKSIAGLTRNAVSSLRRVADTENLDKEDKRNLEEIIATLEILIDQAESYHKYIVTKSEQYISIYNSYKQLSEQKVGILLKLEKKILSDQTGK